MSSRSFRYAGWLLVLMTGLFLAGCAHKKPIEPPLGTFLEDIYTIENRSQDVDKFKNAMPSYLEQLDKQINPKTDEKIVFKAAGAYFAYAFCFIEDTNKEQASELYLKGRNYALGELRRYRLFDEAFNRSGPELKESMAEAFDKRNIQALYLCAVNWVGWINLNLDKPEARADIPKAQAILEFINDLDSSYSSGTAHSALGTLYANRPKENGGDPVSAKEQFDLASSYSGNTLLSIQVMYAKYYATQVKSQLLFRQTLEKVLATPADTYPDKAFVNEIARRKAQLLLDSMDSYFKTPEEKKKEAEAAAKPKEEEQKPAVDQQPAPEQKQPTDQQPATEVKPEPVPPASEVKPEAVPAPQPGQDQQTVPEQKQPTDQQPAAEVKPEPAPPAPEVKPEPVPVPQPGQDQKPAQDQQPATSSYQKEVYYPYTVHMSSYRAQKDALRTYQEKYQGLDAAFITKIDLGSKMGIWYRIDYGACADSKEAVGKLEELRKKGLLKEQKSFIGSSEPYTIEVGVYGKDGADALVKKLLEKEQVPYVIREPGEVYRVVIGAYPDEQSALPALKDFESMDLQPKIVKR